MSDPRMAAEPWRTVEWWGQQYDRYAEDVCRYASAVGAPDPVAVVGDAFVDVAHRIGTVSPHRLGVELLRAAHLAVAAGVVEPCLLTELELEERAAVVLRIGLGRSHDDIAAVLGTDEPTARRLVRRAHDRLVRTRALSLAVR